jgi:hypothetical protein
MTSPRIPRSANLQRPKTPQNQRSRSHTPRATAGATVAGTVHPLSSPSQQSPEPKRPCLDIIDSSPSEAFPYLGTLAKMEGEGVDPERSASNASDASWGLGKITEQQAEDANKQSPTPPPPFPFTFTAPPIPLTPATPRLAPAKLHLLSPRTPIVPPRPPAQQQSSALNVLAQETTQQPPTRLPFDPTKEDAQQTAPQQRRANSGQFYDPTKQSPNQ